MAVTHLNSARTIRAFAVRALAGRSFATRAISARVVATLFMCSTIAACGGGNSDGGVVTPPTGVDPTTPTPTTPTTPTATTITLNLGDLQFTAVGQTVQLTADVRDQKGATMTGVNVSWSMSNLAVASVSPNGLVTAQITGTATVRASVGNLNATANVNVQISNTPTACTTRPVFNEFLIDPSLLKVVTQLGMIGGGNTEIVGRSYAMAIDGDGVRLPLTAPADLKITAAKHYVPQGAPAGYTPDWSLVFDTGCGVTFELYHVKDVAPSIKAAADTTIYPSSAWEPLKNPVSFRAGETFAWYQRGLNSVAFDVIAHDRNVRNHWANQQRYEVGGSNLLDIVCPWEMFAPAKRDAYLAIVGAQTGFRVAGAGCGSVERDVVGSAAGQWFASATLAPFSLSKTGDYGNPFPIVLGVDSTVYVGHTGPNNDIRIYRNNATWKDPAKITTSWCYQIENGSTQSGWLYLRLNSASQMDVSYSQDGLCPASFPASAFMAYYR